VGVDRVVADLRGFYRLVPHLDHLATGFNITSAFAVFRYRLLRYWNDIEMVLYLGRSTRTEQGMAAEMMRGGSGI
jgi:hypothetical protein